MSPEERKMLEKKGFSFDQIMALERQYKSQEARGRRNEETQRMQRDWSFIQWLIATGRLNR